MGTARYQFSPSPIPGGRCTVYADPVPGMTYALGLDCALGIPGKDFDAAILSDSNRQQVAVLHGHWGLDVLPHLVALIDAYGGRSQVFVVGEAASVGVPILRDLFDRGYWLYYGRQEQTKARRIRDILGHVPQHNDPTVRHLQRLIADGSLTIRDEATLTELCKYGFRPKSSTLSPDEATRDTQMVMSAPPGEHDDLVRAMALSMWGVEVLPKFEPPPPVMQPGTIGALIQHTEEPEGDAKEASIWQ